MVILDNISLEFSNIMMGNAINKYVTILLLLDLNTSCSAQVRAASCSAWQLETKGETFFGGPLYRYRFSRVQSAITLGLHETASTPNDKPDMIARTFFSSRERCAYTSTKIMLL